MDGRREGGVRVARKRIGLALSGGVAKGLAHIGVAKALLELGTPIDAVAGTSAGSLVGALIAAAMDPAEMEVIARNTRWRDVARPVLPRLGLFDGGRLEDLLIKVLGDRLIENLSLPFAAVAADLRTGEEVVLRSGSLARAVRASCSVPGFFTPVEMDGRLLVDGGVINNVPVGVARSLGADFVIAVDLSGRIDATPLSRGLVGILLRSYEIMLHEKRSIEARGADILIRPKVERLGLVNLEAASEYIREGYEATLAQREALLDLLEAVKPRSILDYADPRRWRARKVAAPPAGGGGRAGSATGGRTG
jgi:NTE family protein